MWRILFIRHDATCRILRLMSGKVEFSLTEHGQSLPRVEYPGSILDAYIDEHKERGSNAKTRGTRFVA